MCSFASFFASVEIGWLDGLGWNGMRDFEIWVAAGSKVTLDRVSLGFNESQSVSSIYTHTKR